MVLHTARSSMHSNLLSALLIPLVVWFLRDAGVGWRLPAWAALAVTALVVFELGNRWCLRTASAGRWTAATGVIFGSCFAVSGLSWGGLAAIAMPDAAHSDQQAVICGVTMTALAVNLVLSSGVNGAFSIFHTITSGLSIIGFLAQGNGSLAALVTFAAVAMLPLRGELAAHIAEASTLARRNHHLLEELCIERAEAEWANLRLTEANIELSRRATRDALTGLANRELFLEQLAASMARARHVNRVTSVLYLDADHFKEINDTYGPAAGDEVRRTRASRMIGVLGAHLVARLGGDEFAAIVVTQTPDEARALADRVLACFSNGIPVGGRAVPVSVSIGVGSDPGDLTPAALMELADAALYRAKGGGRNQVQVSARSAA